MWTYPESDHFSTSSLIPPWTKAPSSLSWTITTMNWFSYFHLHPFSICSQITGRVIFLKYNSYHIILSSKPSHGSHWTQSKCQSPLTSHLYGHGFFLPAPHSFCKTHWPPCCSASIPGTLPTKELPLLQPLPRILFSGYCHTSFLESLLKHYYLRKPSLTTVLKIAAYLLAYLVSFTVSSYL